MSAFHDLKLDALNGGELPLAPFKGQVVLVVNVASKCGLTPQYKALENLYQVYKDKGFNVLGLPCNQFAGQEPGSEKEIQDFCSLNYGVSFPLGASWRSTGRSAIRYTACWRVKEPSSRATSPGISRSFWWARMGGCWRAFHRVRRRMIRRWCRLSRRRWFEGGLPRYLRRL